MENNIYIYMHFESVMCVPVSQSGSQASSLFRCSVRIYLQLFVGWRMSYLCYLCLPVYLDVPV